MSELDPILQVAYRRAGIQVESAPPVAPVDPQGLTESEIERFALARAGIRIEVEPEGS